MAPGASCGLGVDAMHLGAGQALSLGVQDEVEGDLRIRAIEPVLADLRGIRVAMQLGYQAVAGSEGEVVVQIFITVDVVRRLRIFGQRDKLKANRSKGA
jgi:expansin (peptidoglycan-binding protein)